MRIQFPVSGNIQDNGEYICRYIKKEDYLKCLVKVIVLCLAVIILGMIACTKEEVTNGRVSEKLIAQIDLSSWKLDSLTASPDMKQVACVAEVDDKQRVVVNRKKHRGYNGIGKGSLTFSPDSKCVAYAARMGNKLFVIANKKEGKQYDSIIIMAGGKITFDSSDTLHYLARKVTDIFLVEQRIR